MRRQKVLIVEDDEGLRHGHAGVLASGGYRVSEAATGEEALRRARAEPPDLVLLDAALPDGDGVEVCRRLKAEETLRAPSSSCSRG